MIPLPAQAQPPEQQHPSVTAAHRLHICDQLLDQPPSVALPTIGGVRRHTGAPPTSWSVPAAQRIWRSQ